MAIFLQGTIKTIMRTQSKQDFCVHHSIPMLLGKIVHKVDQRLNGQVENTEYRVFDCSLQKKTRRPKDFRGRVRLYLINKNGHVYTSGPLNLLKENIFVSTFFSYCSYHHVCSRIKSSGDSEGRLPSLQNFSRTFSPPVWPPEMKQKIQHFFFFTFLWPHMCSF